MFKHKLIRIETKKLLDNLSKSDEISQERLSDSWEAMSSAQLL